MTYDVLDSEDGLVVVDSSDPYNPGYGASNALFDSGDDKASNIWLLPSKVAGYFTVDLTKSVDAVLGVRMKNTHNGNSKSERGTKKFVVSVSSDGVTFEDEVAPILPSAKGEKNDITAHVFSFKKPVAARYVRLRADTWYGKGPGLNAFAVLSESLGENEVSCYTTIRKTQAVNDVNSAFSYANPLRVAQLEEQISTLTSSSQKMAYEVEQLRQAWKTSAEPDNFYAWRNARDEYNAVAADMAEAEASYASEIANSTTDQDAIDAGMEIINMPTCAGS
jgi:hypothetical protein